MANLRRHLTTLHRCRAPALWIFVVLLAACGSGATVRSDTATSRLPEYPSLADLREAAADRPDPYAAAAGHYLERIERLDDSGPMLNAVTAIAPDLDAQIERLEEERRAGQLRGPLHGVPVMIKDNIDVAGMATTAGSLALAGHYPPDDAFIVRRMREAGMLILGKTNLSEWANFRSARSISGWSAAGGQTVNPYALDRNPCGSSSGSAVAVAAGFAPLAVGTETDGSLICPAAVNGIVAIKPTLGLVSRDGIVPIAPSQDTAGPMASTVAEAAALLNVLAAHDPADPASGADGIRFAVDYTRHLDGDALRGARIGVARNAMGFSPEVDVVIERLLPELRRAGAVLVDVDIPTHEAFGNAELTVLLHEFRHHLERYLTESGAPVRSLADVIAFNQRHADVELRWFGQDLFERALVAGELNDPAYLAALEEAKRLAGPEGLDAAMDHHALDAILAPATGPAWSNDPVNGDHFLGAGYSSASVAGYPSITVPAGDTHGLPIGVVFLGRAFSEPRLIELAHAFEQLVAARRPPSFQPRIDAGTPPGAR